MNHLTAAKIPTATRTDSMNMGPGERRRLLIYMMLQNFSSLFRKDAGKNSFWSWRRWMEQRRFIHAQGSKEDPFRILEYNFSEWASALAKPHKMLDIGSGRSVFGAYLAKNSGCSLFALDSDPDCEAFQGSVFARLGLANARFVAGNATKIDFPPSFFHRILAVSVVEHFEGEGDILFMGEARRLLKPGGLLVVTVPYSPQYREENQVGYYNGFERRYDLDALRSRLLGQRGMETRDLFFINQRMNTRAERLIRRRYGSLNAFFRRWYEKGLYLSLDRFAIILTSALLYVAHKPDGTTVGAMFTLKKAED